MASKKLSRGSARINLSNNGYYEIFIRLSHYRNSCGWTVRGIYKRHNRYCHFVYSTWQWRWYPVYEIRIFEIPDIIIVTKSDFEDLSNHTYSDLKGSVNFFENSEDNIEILKISSHKNTGFDLLFEKITSRWKNIKRKIKERRNEQDMNWIKRSISDEFGKTGKDKINDYLNYSSKPFSTFEEMRKKLMNF